MISPAGAQDSRGSLVGRALDTTGAAVPGVLVRATNTRTQVTLEAKTNEAGNYAILFVLPGVYDIAGELTGFQKLERKAVEVRVNDNVIVDLAMAIGDVSQSIEVNASTPLLQTGAVSLGQVVDRARLTDLPFQSGNPAELAKIAPGTVSISSLGIQKAAFNNGLSQMVTNGNTPYSNEFMIDGVPNTFAEGNLVRIAFSPPQGALGGASDVLQPAEHAESADGDLRYGCPGIAHIALYVHDIEAARTFYKDFLGYGEPFKLDNTDGSLSLTFIKVNDRQYIELFPEKKPQTDRLVHISIEVDDAEAMRAYLAANGVKVPAKVGKGRVKNSNFMVTDPDGHLVEVVQYEPDGWTVRDNGKFLSDARISPRIKHLGITVGSLEPAMKFYGELLGFKEIWRGSKEGKVLEWVNMRVPDGDDYLEFMLYDQAPSLNRLGTLHHICLEVPDLPKALASLEARPAKSAYTKPMEIKTGTNRKRQLNLFDPDGARSELMEPHTVDGKPVPSSTARPPR